MLFLMLVAQGIESNPGPWSDSGATGGDVPGRASTLEMTEGVVAAVEGGVVLNPEDFFADEPVAQNRRITRSSQSRAQFSQQRSIEGWLNLQPSQPTQQSQSTGELGAIAC